MLPLQSIQILLLLLDNSLEIFEALAQWLRIRLTSCCNVDSQRSLTQRNKESFCRSSDLLRKSLRGLQYIGEVIID